VQAVLMKRRCQWHESVI